MRVLVVTPWFPNHPESQDGSFILDSVEALVREEHAVHVLVTRPLKPAWTIQAEDRRVGEILPEMHRRGFSITMCRYLGIPGARLRFISNELFVASCRGTLRRLLEQQPFDVVHAHTDLAGYVSARVRDRTGAPVVTTLHGVNTEHRYWHGAGQRRFFRTVCSSPERLVIVGEPLRSFVESYVSDLSHVRVVHNGFRTSSAKPYRATRAIRPSDTLQLISVSNLVEGKGVDTNLRALARLNQRRLKDWHYHVVGGGALRDTLESMAADLNVAGQVTFHGATHHDQVFHLLSRAHLFTLPSAPEAFGVAYLEAMACGLAVIGAEREGPSSYLSSGVNGFLVPAGDDERLANVIAGLYSDRGRLAACAAAGQELAWSRFTWDAHARVLTGVYREAIETAARVRSAARR